MRAIETITKENKKILGNLFAENIKSFAKRFRDARIEVSNGVITIDRYSIPKEAVRVAVDTFGERVQFGL